MLENITLARPYAKAIFQIALQQNALAAWSSILSALAQTVLDSRVTDFIDNPMSTLEMQEQLVLAAFNDKTYPEFLPQIKNMIKLLAQNKRLLLLPEIDQEFLTLRAESEKKMTAHVMSFAALNQEQKQQLIQRLSQRLQRQVTLEVSVDKTLLGGAIIRAGDLVIDGSVRGTLNKLAHSLAA